MLGDNKFNATSGSQGAAFRDIIVPGLILQILNNFPIPITVFFRAICGGWNLAGFIRNGKVSCTHIEPTGLD